MSEKPIIKGFLLAVSCSLLLATDAAASTGGAAPAAAPYEQAQVIAVGETAHASSLPGEPACFRVLIPAPGLIEIEAAAPGTEDEPWLGLPSLDLSLGLSLGLSPGLSPGRQGVAVIEGTATRRLLATGGPGELLACVRARDPRRGLAELTLRTSFVDLDDLDKGEEIEVEPDGLTPGQDVVAELGDAPDGGPERDAYTFELTAPQTVQIETHGGLDTFGVLYDGRGERLATAADGGEGGNFRLVRSLLPGRYTVRVEAESWGEGAYALTLDLLDLGW